MTKYIIFLLSTGRVSQSKNVCTHPRLANERARNLLLILEYKKLAQEVLGTNNIIIQEQ